MKEPESFRTLPAEGHGLERHEWFEIEGRLTRHELTFHLYLLDLSETWQGLSSCLNLAEIQASLREEGTYEILNCSCGEMGCANRWHGVNVWHRGADVIWQDLDRGAWLRLSQDRLRKELDFWARSAVRLEGDRGRDGFLTITVRPEPWHNDIFFGNPYEPD